MDRRVFFCVLLLTLSGCSLFAKPAPSLKGYTPVSDSMKADVVAKLAQESARITSARGSLRSTFSKSLHRETVRQIVVFQRPDKMRVELFATSLNQLTLLAVSHDGLIEAYDPGAGVLFRGRDVPANIERVVSVPFSPEELMLWFSGRVPFIEEEIEKVDVLEHKGGGRQAVRLLLKDGRRIEAEFTAGGAPHLVTLVLLGRKGSDPVFVSKTTYAPGGDVPQHASIQVSGENIDGELEYESFTLNPDLSSSRVPLFQIHVNSSMRIEDLDHDTTIQLP
ncbi:MAG: hypothetical protein U0136_20040 [Bdellovibrionota bacterium]